MSTIELLWAVVSYGSILGIMLITGICFSYFVRPYLLSKKTAVCVGTTYFVIMVFLYIVPLKLNNFIAYAIGILAAFIVMNVKERRNVEQKIFLAVTFFSIRWLTLGMADKIDSLLMDKIVMQQKIVERLWLQFGLYAGFKVVDVGVSFLFIMASIYLLNKSFEYKRTNMTKKELLMLTMPSISGITGYGILQFYQNTYERDTGKSLSFGYGIYGYFSFLHYLISIISILVMVILFQNVKARQVESAGQKLIQSQIADMKKHINEVEELYQDIRLLRHDMGNHIQTIEQLLAKNEKIEAVEYTARLREKWQDITSEIKSGNPVTDVILLEKKKKAKKQNVRFLCDFYYPEETELDAFDVSVILNNALDNSLESVNGPSPYISISSYRKNNIFMILITNSFEGHIVLDEDTGLPISRKKEMGHGLGLANIRRVAQMYFGDIAFEQEEGKIILTIMLQLEKEIHNKKESTHYMTVDK